MKNTAQTLVITLSSGDVDRLVVKVESDEMRILVHDAEDEPLIQARFTDDELLELVVGLLTALRHLRSGTE